MCILLNACSQHGLVLTRWLTIHNSMLEKALGNDRLDKLRVIHLFEADLNLLMSILWSRRLLNNEINHKSLSPFQWGGMKGIQGVDPILMKVLSFELSAYTRTSLTEVDKDAASCYDRIVMALSNHRDQQLGMPVGPCQMLGMVLEFARYYVKTANNISAESYQSTAADPLYGPGQGNKLSPPKWTVISTICCNILQTIHSGAMFCDPEDSVHSQRPIDTYVDDASCWNNKFVVELLLHTTQEYDIDRALHLLKTMVTESE